MKPFSTTSELSTTFALKDSRPSDTHLVYHGKLQQDPKERLAHKLLVGCGAQDSEAAHEVVVDRHNGAGVVELSAVVRCGKESHQLPVCLELVAIFHHLAESADVFTASTHATTASAKVGRTATNILSTTKKRACVERKRRQAAVAAAAAAHINHLQPLPLQVKHGRWPRVARQYETPR